MATRTWVSELSSKRSQHLVFLAHVWVFTPFLVVWLTDKSAETLLGSASYGQLRPVVWLTLAYLAVRTWLAYRDPPKLKWQYVFPPIDVALITLILSVSHRGPLSNVMLLFFLPIVAAAGSLSVRWSALIGILVVIGTAVSTSFGLTAVHDLHAGTLRELWLEDPVNVVFRLFFMVVLSSL